MVGLSTTRSSVAMAFTTKRYFSTGYDGVTVEIGSDALVEAERTLVLKFFLVGIFLETAYLKSLVGVLHASSA